MLMTNNQNEIIQRERVALGVILIHQNHQETIHFESIHYIFHEGLHKFSALLYIQFYNNLYLYE